MAERDGRAKPAKRKRDRLAFGEYVPAEPSNDRDQAWMAQRELIVATARVCPSFLETLSNEVYPLYDRLAKSGYSFAWTFAGPSGTSSYERLASDPASPPEITARLASLKAELYKWARRFNAESAGWLLDAALNTMRSWYVAPDRRESCFWDAPFGRTLTFAVPLFTCSAWNVQDLTFAAYRKVVLQCLQKYEKEIRQLAESHGLVPAHRSFRRVKFEWFALYQFAGQSTTEIAKRELAKRPASTVLKGIKAVGKLIGWEQLRKSQNDRSRKTR